MELHVQHSFDTHMHLVYPTPPIPEPSVPHAHNFSGRNFAVMIMISHTNPNLIHTEHAAVAYIHRPYIIILHAHRN